MKILHCFADEGVESELLAEHGSVVRVGIDPTNKNQSQPIKANAKQLPFSDGVTFDLGVFHPPCGFVSPMSATKNGSQDDWENMIPLARDLGKRFCDHYIIENKYEAREYMQNPVTLSGGMFGQPYEVKRIFETSYDVEQPPQHRTFGEADGQGFFSSEHSTEWWATVKGYSPKYRKDHLAKNTIPRVYLRHILAGYYKAIDTEDRPDYSNYDKEMDAKRAQEQNKQLTEWQ